jgi:hypothetical protein
MNATIGNRKGVNQSMRTHCQNAPRTSRPATVSANESAPLRLRPSFAATFSMTANDSVTGPRDTSSLK